MTWTAAPHTCHDSTMSATETDTAGDPYTAALAAAKTMLLLLQQRASFKSNFSYFCLQETIQHTESR